MVGAKQHPVLKSRDDYGCIHVPLADKSLLCWVRLERLQPTCRAAGIPCADGFVGWEKNGRFNKPVKEGVVVAQRDVPTLVDAVETSARESAQREVVEVARALARQLVKSAQAIRVAVWADAHERSHRRITSLFRKYLCPQHPKTEDERELLSRKLEAAGFTSPAIKLVDRLIEAAADPNPLRRARELVAAKGMGCSHQEVDLALQPYLDDVPFEVTNWSAEKGDGVRHRVGRAVAKFAGKDVDQLLERLLRDADQWFAA